jgi:hypothetical protein
MLLVLRTTFGQKKLKRISFLLCSLQRKKKTLCGGHVCLSSVTRFQCLNHWIHIFLDFIQDASSIKVVKQFWLKLDKNKTLYIVTYKNFCMHLEHNSLNIYQRGKYFKQKLYRKMKHTFYIQHIFL